MRIWLAISFTAALSWQVGRADAHSVDRPSSRPIRALQAAAMIGQSGTTARQVALKQSDLPGAVLVPAQTHTVPGIGDCSSGYQSLFGSGLGGSEAVVSVVYQCPSASAAAQVYSQTAAYYQQYYDRKEWHYQVLPAVKAGHEHFAWFNRGLPGTHTLSGSSANFDAISLVFQRDNFIVFVQVTYTGETLAKAEQSVHRLAHIMNRRIVVAAG